MNRQKEYLVGSQIPNDLVANNVRINISDGEWLQLHDKLSA